MVLQELQSRLQTGLSGSKEGVSVVERSEGPGLKSDELTVTSILNIKIKILQTANFPGSTHSPDLIEIQDLFRSKIEGK